MVANRYVYVVDRAKGKVPFYRRKAKVRIIAFGLEIGRIITLIAALYPLMAGDCEKMLRPSFIWRFWRQPGWGAGLHPVTPRKEQTVAEANTAVRFVRLFSGTRFARRRGRAVDSRQRG